MGKSIHDKQVELREKHNTSNNTVDDFSVGDKVKVICLHEDHYFFYEETGVVIEIIDSPYSIKVGFDEPRVFEDGYVQKEFYFQPINLLILEKPKPEREGSMRYYIKENMHSELRSYLRKNNLRIQKQLNYWFFESRESFHGKVIDNGIEDFVVFFDSRVPSIYIPMRFVIEE